MGCENVLTVKVVGGKDCPRLTYVQPQCGKEYHEHTHQKPIIYVHIDNSVVNRSLCNKEITGSNPSKYMYLKVFFMFYRGNRNCV